MEDLILILVLSGIDLAYHQAQKKIGTEVEIYIDPSDPEKYFCPADVKMYRMIQICLLCCGWLAIVGTRPSPVLY